MNTPTTSAQGEQYEPTLRSFWYSNNAVIASIPVGLHSKQSPPLVEAGLSDSFSTGRE